MWVPRRRASVRPSCGSSPHMGAVGLAALAHPPGCVPHCVRGEPRHLRGAPHTNMMWLALCCAGGVHGDPNTPGPIPPNTFFRFWGRTVMLVRYNYHSTTSLGLACAAPCVCAVAVAPTMHAVMCVLFPPLPLTWCVRMLALAIMHLRAVLTPHPAVALVM